MCNFTKRTFGDSPPLSPRVRLWPSLAVNENGGVRPLEREEKSPRMYVRARHTREGARRHFRLGGRIPSPPSLDSVVKRGGGGGEAADPPTDSYLTLQGRRRRRRRRAMASIGQRVFFRLWSVVCRQRFFGAKSRTSFFEVFFFLLDTV